MTASTTFQASLSQEPTTFYKGLTLLGGVLLLAIASQLSIPLQPVPLTFQSSAVVLIGMMFGARQGAGVVMAYLFAGFCGLPVFADFMAGPSVFAGPTAGYLLGFLPAAYLSGYLMEKGWSRNVFTRFAAAMVGSSVIFLAGVTLLSKFTGSYTSAFALGALPFMFSEPVKLAFVAALIRKNK